MCVFDKVCVAMSIDEDAWMDSNKARAKGAARSAQSPFTWH